MRWIKLAWRTILTLRRAIVPSVLIVSVSAFLIVLAGGAIVPMHKAIRQAAASLEGVHATPAFLVEEESPVLPVFLIPFEDGDQEDPATLPIATIPARIVTGDPAATTRVLSFLVAGANNPIRIATDGPITEPGSVLAIALPATTGQPAEAARSALEGVQGERAEASARSMLRSGNRLIWGVAGLLTLFCVASLVPGSALLFRRMGPSLTTLHAWGFSQPAKIRWLMLSAALSAAVAGAIGGVAGLVAGAIASTRETLSVDLLPQAMVLAITGGPGVAEAGLLDPILASIRSAAGRAIVTPPVEYFAAVVVVSTLLGALGALPSAGIAATLAKRSIYGGTDHSIAQHHLHSQLHLPRRNAAHGRR